MIWMSFVTLNGKRFNLNINCIESFEAATRAMANNTGKRQEYTTVPITIVRTTSGVEWDVPLSIDKFVEEFSQRLAQLADQDA